MGRKTYAQVILEELGNSRYKVSRHRLQEAIEKARNVDVQRHHLKRTLAKLVNDGTIVRVEGSYKLTAQARQVRRSIRARGRARGRARERAGGSNRGSREAKCDESECMDCSGWKKYKNPYRRAPPYPSKACLDKKESIKPGSYKPNEPDNAKVLYEVKEYENGRTRWVLHRKDGVVQTLSEDDEPADDGQPDPDSDTESDSSDSDSGSDTDSDDGSDNDPDFDPDAGSDNDPDFEPESDRVENDDEIYHEIIRRRDWLEEERNDAYDASDMAIADAAAATNRLLDLRAVYPEDMAPPEESDEFYLTDERSNELMQSARVYHDKCDDSDLIKDLVAQREPVNMKMTRFHSADELTELAGYAISAYSSYFEVEDELAPNIAVYVQTPVWAGEEIKGITHVLNVIGMALDSEEQPDYLAMDDFDGDHEQMMIEFLGAVTAKIQQCIVDVEHHLRSKKVVPLEKIYLSAFGSGDFASLYTEFQGENGYQDLLKDALDLLMKRPGMRGKRFALMGDSGADAELADRIGVEYVGTFNDVLQDLTSEALARSMFINSWNPHSVPGNGNNGDESLDGQIGRRSAIGWFGWGVTNQYLREPSRHVEVQPSARAVKVAIEIAKRRARAAAKAKAANVAATVAANEAREEAIAAAAALTEKVEKRAAAAAEEAKAQLAVAKATATAVNRQQKPNAKARAEAKQALSRAKDRPFRQTRAARNTGSGVQTRAARKTGSGVQTRAARKTGGGVQTRAARKKTK